MTVNNNNDIINIKKGDCFVNAMIANTKYTFTAYGKTFTIDRADLVKAE